MHLVITAVVTADVQKPTAQVNSLLELDLVEDDLKSDLRNVFGVYLKENASCAFTKDVECFHNLLT